ncbi:unnamed protein product [Clavelina lepadiformis]|uniref:Ferritin n=1 Tax=Clavelina lepadiformis TaxID=159417 RepID=A0ABP0FC16_CLALP
MALFVFEDELNRMINLKLYGSYAYKELSYIFDGDHVAMKSVAAKLRKRADELQEKAEHMMSYLNTRGGMFVATKITKPPSLDSTQLSIENTITYVSTLEEVTNKSVLKLYNSAVNDPELQGFLQDNCLHNHVAYMKELRDLMTNVKRVGEGLGQFLIDKKYFSQ